MLRMGHHGPLQSAKQGTQGNHRKHSGWKRTSCCSKHQRRVAGWACICILVVCSRKKQAARDAGWEVLEYSDLAEPRDHYPIKWYAPLQVGGLFFCFFFFFVRFSCLFQGAFNLSNLRSTLVGRAVTSIFCYVFETLRILPRGTYDTQQFLIRGADGLVAGGVSETFTPMFFFLCRKV
jgi:hypothetical protein